MSITADERAELVKKVQSNGTKLLDRLSIRLSVHESEHAGQTVRFVYDKKRGVIVTFLHRDPHKYLEEALVFAKKGRS